MILNSILVQMLKLLKLKLGRKYLKLEKSSYVHILIKLVGLWIVI